MMRVQEELEHKECVVAGNTLSKNVSCIPGKTSTVLSELT